jgi:hypothetical protein
MPRSVSTLRMRLALESKRSSSVSSAAVCRASTRSSAVVSRASAPSTPAAVAFAGAARRRDGVGSSRDSSRASRSGGAVKITVSLIGEALGVTGLDGSVIGVGRLLIEPVGVGSGTPASVEARDSSVACRRMICSSF